MRRQKKGPALALSLKYKRRSERDLRYRMQDTGYKIRNFYLLIDSVSYILSLIFLVCFTSCSQPKLIPVVQVPSVSSEIGVNYISTMKGDFSQPSGIVINTDGNLYLSDSGKSMIYVLDREGKSIELIGRFGWQVGEFDHPIDVALDSRLRLYIADSGNNRVQKYSLTEQNFSVIVGDKGDNSEASLSIKEPLGVAIDRTGYIYIVDTWNNRILKTDPIGRIQMQIGGSGRFNNPQGVMIDNSNNIYVCDTGNNRICKLDFSGVQIAVWGKEGSAKGQFQNPTNASYDRDGNVYVVDQGNHRIQIFKPDGTYITEFGQSELEKPFDIAIDNEDHAYVTDLSSADIEVFKIIK
jgi:tripartite motif-containing protein 71